MAIVRLKTQRDKRVIELVNMFRGRGPHPSPSPSPSFLVGGSTSSSATLVNSNNNDPKLKAVNELLRLTRRMVV